MTLTLQHKLLLLAVTLALARFAVVPWVAQQGQQREQLQLVTRQLARAQQLIHNTDSIAAASQTVEAAQQALAAQFPLADSSGQYRLGRQQHVQQSLAEFAVEISLFDWLSQSSLPDQQIDIHQARIVLQGIPLALMQGYQSTFAADPWLRVRQFELRQQPSRQRQGAAQATLTLLVEFTSLTGTPEPPPQPEGEL